MKHTRKIWMAVMLAVLAGPLAALLATSALAQGFSRLSGTVNDIMGKPYANLTILLTNKDTNRAFTTTTDAKGYYSVANLPGGTYNVDLKEKDKVVYQAGLVISASSQPVANFDLKAIMEKERATNGEAEAKRAEAEKAFAGLKAHFDAGLAAIDVMKAAQAELAKIPKDQKDAQAPIQDRINKAGTTATTELSAALETMKPDDSNRPIILARMGEAYETMGKWQEAADTYQQAITLKPDVAANYNNLGNDLAKLGKVDDAKTAYQKYVDLDPTNAALAWRNFGIVLYQANRMKEAIEPLQKATTLDPMNAQAWLLLGIALVNTMEFKTVGDKITPVILPGTIEAYQKAVDLDPNGNVGAQAKQGLESLQAMGVGGIDIKVGKARTPAPAPAKGKK